MRQYFPEGFSPNSVEVNEIYKKFDVVFYSFFDNLAYSKYNVHCTFSGPKAKLCFTQIQFFPGIDSKAMVL